MSSFYLFIYLFSNCVLLPSGFSANARCCFQVLLPLSPLTALQAFTGATCITAGPSRPALLIRSTLTLDSFVSLSEIDGHGTSAQSFHVLIKAFRSAIERRQAARVCLWSESIFIESERRMGDKVHRPDVQS